MVLPMSQRELLNQQNTKRKLMISKYGLTDFFDHHKEKLSCGCGCDPVYESGVVDGFYEVIDAIIKTEENADANR